MTKPTMPRFALAAAFAALVACGFTASLAAQRNTALNRANLDTTCAPCTDFYQFANGSWLKTHTIPPDKTSLGSFGMLGDKNQEVVQHIVDRRRQARARRRNEVGHERVEDRHVLHGVHGHGDDGRGRLQTDQARTRRYCERPRRRTTW